MNKKNESTRTSKRILTLSVVFILLIITLFPIPSSVGNETVTVAIELKSGWNLKGLPESITASDLADKSRYISSIVHRTSSSYYLTYIPSLDVKDFKIESNEGVFIYSEADTTLVFIIEHLFNYNDGDFTVTGDLKVSGAGLFYNNLSVNGSLSAIGDLHVDNLNITGDLEVDGSLTVNEDLYVGKSMSVSEDLFVGQDLNAGNQIKTKDMHISEYLVVKGDATVEGETEVAGDMIVHGTLTASDFSVYNLTIDEDLMIDGNLSVVQDMVVAGDSKIIGDTIIEGSLSANDFTANKMMITDDLSINGNLSVTNDVYVGGNSVVQGDMIVNGSLIAKDFAVYSLYIATDMDIDGNMSVDGDVTIGGNSVITGDLHIVGTLTAGDFTVGNLTFTDDLTLDGKLAVTGSAIILGDATIDGNLTAGDFSVSNLTITEDLAINGNLSIEGNTIIGGNAKIMGNLSAGDFTVSNLTVSDNISIDGDFNVMNDLIVGQNLYVSGDIKGATGRTSTFIIAANDSGALGKLQADYVCDGTDDQIEIQEAIDSLPPNGGKILLMEGTYNMNPSSVSDYRSDYNTAVKLVDNLIIEGMGESTLLKFPDYLPSYRMMFEIYGKENIRIEKLKFDLNVRMFPTSTMISAVHIRSFSWSKSHIIIKDCHFHDGRWSISGDGTAGYYDYVVVNNLFTSDPANKNHYGINLHNYGTHSIVSGNTIYGLHTGIFLDTMKRAIVSDNIINTTYRGIYIDDGANDNIIKGNYIESPTGVSFDARTGRESHRNLITGNHIIGSNTGIFVNGNDNVISNNYFYDVDLAINNTQGINSLIQDNMGYETERSGTTSEGTSIVVTHGLAGTPNQVIITPLGQTDYYYVINKGTTTFTIVSQASCAFDWFAVYKP